MSIILCEFIIEKSQDKKPRTKYERKFSYDNDFRRSENILRMNGLVKCQFLNMEMKDRKKFLIFHIELGHRDQ